MNASTSHRALLDAERAIKDLGGRSERIQLNDAGGGLKFILKCGWVLQEIHIAGNSGHCYTDLRAIIAEDNEVNAIGLSDLLMNFGIEVDIAVDGKGAIDQITRNGIYDLVLMDLDMPHMNGFEATRFIRKKLKSVTPIICLSAAPFSEVEVSYEETGLNHCIFKSSASEGLPGLLSCFLGRPEEVSSTQKIQHPLLQWGEHPLIEAYKHTTLIHQHRPAS